MRKRGGGGGRKKLVRNPYVRDSWKGLRGGTEGKKGEKENKPDFYLWQRGKERFQPEKKKGKTRNPSVGN